MSILDLYAELLKDRERFIDEVFEAEIYKLACPRLTVVDVGAYRGEFGFYCLPFADKIYCIEPDPHPYASLIEYIKDFGLEDKVSSFPIALSNKNGPRVLYASGYGGSSLQGEDHVSAGNKEIKVDTLTLNSFLTQNGIEFVDILKIDVESSEGEILLADDIEPALARVKLIIGEDHGCGEIVRKVLERNGFEVNFKAGLFWGRKNK